MNIKSTVPRRLSEKIPFIVILSLYVGGIIVKYVKYKLIVNRLREHRTALEKGLQQFR